MDETAPQRVFELEAALIEHVRASKNGATVHFQYARQDNKWRLDTVTRRADHGVAFVLHTQLGATREDCLRETLERVQDVGDHWDIYTVVWGMRGATDRVNSFFRGRCIAEVVQKFYEVAPPRDKLVMWSITLSPES